MKTQLALRMPRHEPSSFHIHLFGICLCLITACSVFKEKSFFETDSLQRRSRREVIRQESDSQTKAIHIYSSSDTTDRRTLAEIYPKGNFRYSPADGYIGEAERMLISERVRHEKLVTGSARLMQSTNSSAAVEEKNKFEKQTKEKNEKLNPGRNRWFYLAGCGLIFVLVFLVRNFLNED